MSLFRLGSRVAPRALARTVAFNTSRVSLGQASTRVFSSQPPALHELGSVDHGFEDDRIDKVAEPERRAFTYFMLSTIRFAYASATRLALVKFLSNLSPSADVLALAFSEFDLAGMEFGKSMSVMWRGKPIFIRRRTPEEIAEVRSVPMDHLRDQEHDEDRVMNDDYIVVIAICPHLGCVPVADAGDYDAFFCPCHGSHYDISGRIRKGPAPLNLEVPPYKFIGDYTILMG